MIGRTRWHFPEVASTQDTAFELANQGAAHGTVVRADFQSAGRGRQGRSWDAPALSSLMFSVLLRPHQPLHELTNISILTAKVLAGVFATYTTAPISIKWPNDVLIDGRKVSGILLQTRSVPDPVAVLGIGINISAQSDVLPEHATSLASHTETPIDADALLDSILAGLNQIWDRWESGITNEAIRQLDKQLWLNGELVSLQDGDRSITGTILGIAQNGGLRLNVGGHERTVVAGEITRGPRRIQGSDAK